MMLLKGPGKYLVLMNWWLVAFFIHRLSSYPLSLHARSYLPYFVWFTCTLLAVGCWVLLEASTSIWSRRGLLGKSLMVAISYTAITVASVTITLILDSAGKVGYFGGDAAGSFMMLWAPSIVFHWFACGLACGIMTLLRSAK